MNEYSLAKVQLNNFFRKIYIPPEFFRAEASDFSYFFVQRYAFSLTAKVKVKSILVHLTLFNKKTPQQ